ncbi:putative pectinesterase/pectinesterase inhibitor 43 [Hirschfeldia incana]|nr:putative pectinesterase/pectinesterase inhibitor 43 [Hirschfeldia incana]
MLNGWNNSSRKKSFALLGITSLYMVMAICAGANEGSGPSRKTEEIHRGSKLMIKKTAVSVICSSTDYKQDCIETLETVRSLDPRNLIRAVFDLAIISIRSGINRAMIDIKSRADADVRTRDALNSCWELMDFAIDDLLKTRDTFKGFLFTRLSDFIDDLLVWLSGSVTYQQTCIDGFEGIDSVSAEIMEMVMRKGQHLTSNGLAIASNLDALLKTFRIPIPFLRPERDGLGIFGSDSPQEQPLDSPKGSPQMWDSSNHQQTPQRGDPSKNKRLGSSMDSPSQNLNGSKKQQLDSSENQPHDYSKNQPLDSSENQSRDYSENQPLDSSENQPFDSSKDSPQNLNPSKNQEPDLSKSRPLDSYSTRPLDSSRNQPLVFSKNTPQKVDSSESRPLDPLRKLNPLGALNPFGKLEDRHLSEEIGFPRWVTTHSRRLLAERGRKISANVVVAKDGSGKCQTIQQALAMVPMKNQRTFVIYIKQGVYNERIEVTIKMKNVMFVGDGPTKTIITGNVAFLPDRIGTYSTSTVAVNGDYFTAKDIGFENTAGAARHQAVALRVSGDFAVFFNCRMDGYQDTLYVHTHRQFYRDCRISGTIDIVFGDAKAVFQNCEFVIRRPMDNQQCIITAQGRTDRRETTGIIIDNSRITCDETYLPVKDKYRAFLGRPWKEYSRTIIMNTYIDDVIDPEGWLKWNETFALNTLFFSEYRNRGRGSDQDRRVRWGGIQQISNRQARGFAPGDFLRGNAWIPERGIPYNAY